MIFGGLAILNSLKDKLLRAKGVLDDRGRGGLSATHDWSSWKSWSLFIITNNWRLLID
jgi:hypothetical protein